MAKFTPFLKNNLAKKQYLTSISNANLSMYYLLNATVKI